MPRFMDILLYIALPLVWGLAVEFVFERLRRHRARRKMKDPGEVLE